MSSNTKKKLSKKELNECEFDSDGVWNWVHPEGRSPPSPRPVQYTNMSDFMTANEYLRAENNRKKALEKLSKAREKVSKTE